MPKKLKPAAPPADPLREKVTNRTASPPGIKEIGGSGHYVWDMTLINRVAIASPTFMVDGEDYTKKMAAIALRSFEPTDAVEGMLAACAIALHHASLECSRRAMLQGKPGEVASRLRRDAANSARAMIEITEALQRRKGKGPQTIPVERVVVQGGGQAVVAGSVTGGGALSASHPAAAAIAQGEPAMELVTVATETSVGYADEWQ